MEAVEAVLLVFHDGRTELLRQTLESFCAEAEWDWFDLHVLVNDVPSPEYVDLLDAQFCEPYGMLQAHHSDDEDRKWGFGGAIRQGHHFVRQVVGPGDFSDALVFHLEDDFTFQRRVPLEDMSQLLLTHEGLAQVSLLRQPWNREERRAGGIVQADPLSFTEVWEEDLDVVYTYHERYFTTNPSMYLGKIVEDPGWPEGDHSEGRFGLALRERGYGFAIMGPRNQEPAVIHTGEARVGEGY